MQKCTSIEGRGLILSWEDFCLSGDTWQSLEMFLIVTAGGGAVLMESSGWSPETLLNILQCKTASTMENYSVQNVNTVKTEKPFYVTETQIGKNWTF